MSQTKKDKEKEKEGGRGEAKKKTGSIFTSPGNLMLKKFLWQGKILRLLNKIIDNFILTKERKLWARGENSRNGWRSEGL